VSATTSIQIRLDRARVDRFWGRLTLATLVLVVAALVALTGALVHADAGLVDLLPFAVLVPVLCAYVGVTLGLSWRRVRGIAVPLSLEGRGITLHSSYGDVTAPWAAVASADLEPRLLGPCLRVRLVGPADPRRALIASSLTRPHVQRILESQGFRYSLRVLSMDAAQLRGAFAEQSGGRVLLDG
jgi:hypothetical protein